MDKPTWKAGDTCTIKPKTTGISKYACGDLWTVARVTVAGEMVVHNGAAGNLDGFGMSQFATLPASRLLPPGDARPSIEGGLGAEVLRLRARVAELEAAQRWRVTAEELPPEGEWVVGHYGGSEPCEVVQYDGDQWNFRGLLDVNEPDFWMPIPAVPHG